MDRLFVDTSAWLAHANRRDAHHLRVREAIQGFPGRLVTTNYIFDETITLAGARFGHGPAVAIGGVLRDAAVVDLLRLTAAQEQEAWQFFVERPDKDYSFTDCTSFVLMRQLRLTTAASLDADFVQEGFSILP